MRDIFHHCFLVFGYPGETLALVVHILHQTCVDKYQSAMVENEPVGAILNVKFYESINCNTANYFESSKNGPKNVEKTRSGFSRAISSVMLFPVEQVAARLDLTSNNS